MVQVAGRKRKTGGQRGVAAPTKARVGKTLDILAKTYPDARIELNFSTPLELLVATILSAQCTDTRVNQVTPFLFKKYPSARAYAQADPPVFEEEIRSIFTFNVWSFRSISEEYVAPANSASSK